MDKNNSAIYSFCPNIFRRNLLDLFDCTKQTANYTIITKDKMNIKQLWQSKYTQCKVNLGKINMNGSIPYAYAIPKFKDFQRFRPIVSYITYDIQVNVFWFF